MIRAFLIKFLFGRYWWKLPDKSWWLSTKYFKWMSWLSQSRYNATDRGSFWNYSGFILLAILWLITGMEIWLQAAIPWGLQVLYFGFSIGGIGYFSKYPVHWIELDEEQKWFYGDAAQSGDLTKKLEFTPAMMQQWIYINKKLSVKYRRKK